MPFFQSNPHNLRPLCIQRGESLKHEHDFLQYSLYPTKAIYHGFSIVALELMDESAGRNDLQMVTAFFFCSLGSRRHLELMPALRKDERKGLSDFCTRFLPSVSRGEQHSRIGPCFTIDAALHTTRKNPEVFAMLAAR